MSLYKCKHIYRSCCLEIFSSVLVLKIFHSQPTEDDPVPDSLFTLTRDRYALPSQPEQRNLQHLLSSFTPRVEPISASTQQLRRLASRPRHQQYADENARRDSFNDWPSNTGQNPENMVTNGFFYTGWQNFSLLHDHCPHEERLGP